MSAASAESWFVYYKLPVAEVDATAPRVRALLADVERRCGVRGRLLRKHDGAAGVATLMEVYEPVPEAARFSTALDEAARAALPAALCAARRVERFGPA